MKNLSCSASVLLAFLGTSWSTQALSAVVADASVSRDSAKDAYQIEWRTEPKGAPVTIRVSNSASESPKTIVATGAVGGSFRWQPGEASHRHYFSVSSDDNSSRVAATRLLPLEGGRNFRDLGGYATADGRTVKWGKVFRSGVMDGLTDADYDYLSSLGIKTVCDLRAAAERKAEPTDWRAGKVEYVSYPDPAEDEDAPNPLSALADPDITPVQVAAAMAEGYVGIAYEQAPAYRNMFDRMAGGEIPLAFNCSAGKDRTGIGAALLLTLLGVPRETVVADYSLSDDYVDYMRAFASQMARDKARDNGSPYAFLFELPLTTVQPLMRSDPMYIETALTAIEEKFGSVETFIRDELDITESEANAIRNALLE